MSNDGGLFTSNADVDFFCRPPAKRRKREDSPEELSDESEEESDEDLELPDEVIREATPEAAEGEAVLGRGGTRRAKVST